MFTRVGILICCMQFIVVTLAAVKYKKHGCYEGLSKANMLLSWRGEIKGWDVPTYTKFVNRLASTCAEHAHKSGAAGFALFWWGQCFAVTKDELAGLGNGDKSGSCYRGDGSFQKCVSDSDATNCIGDDSGFYVYTVSPAGCEFEGKTYKPGEKFVPADCSGICTCQENGSGSCVTLCPPSGPRRCKANAKMTHVKVPVGLSNGRCSCKQKKCVVDGCQMGRQRYKIGEKFTSKDCKGRCTCQENGRISCVTLCPPNKVIKCKNTEKTVRVDVPDVGSGGRCTCPHDRCESIYGKLVGKWHVSYTNGYSDTYTVSPEGKVHVQLKGTNTALSPSDNQKAFPSSQGWFKMNHVHRSHTWEYIRLKSDGHIEIEHFCSDIGWLCKHHFRGVGRFCCSGNGTPTH